MTKVPSIETLENPAAGPDDPLPLFQAWFADAEAAEPNDPNAMSLATVDPDGRPSLRIVLLKAVDERGFVFFTNRESRKGLALKANPRAALCFYWRLLDRQIRIEGPCEQITDDESDDYFSTRPRGSRLGAWASKQSRPLENRDALKKAVDDYDAQFGATETIPRPAYWGGYRVKPERIEFWHEGKDRLHTRLVYTRDGKGWKRQMLYP